MEENQAPFPDDEETIEGAPETTPPPPPAAPFSASRADRVRRRAIGGQAQTAAIPPLPSRISQRPAPPDDDESGLAGPPVSQPPPPPPPTPRPLVRPPPLRTHAHLTAGMAYLGMPIIPAIILLAPRSHAFSRFHARQALGVFVILITLSLGLGLVTPTNIFTAILYSLLVGAMLLLGILWMVAAIASFEGYGLALPLLDRVIPREDDLHERPTGQSSASQTWILLAIAAAVALIALLLTVALPLKGWFGALAANLPALGQPDGLPTPMFVLALLTSLIYAAIGLVALIVLFLGMSKSKLYPLWGGIVGAALTATGTGLLIADTMQRSLASQLTQQFNTVVNAMTIPSHPDATKAPLTQITNGLTGLHALTQAQTHLLIPGAIFLLLGVLALLGLLAQVFYQR